MIIQWDKWVMERLPMKLRTVLLFAFCTAFTEPVVRLYNELVKWQRKMKTKSGGSPQVCMIKRTVFDELGIMIEILEGDGKPVDFIIQTAFTDTDKERQLFALLDRYKLAGKSYAYENKEITFECTWSKYMCEDNPLRFGWSKWVCELHKPEAVNTITITYYWQYDESWGAKIIKRMRFTAEHPVQTDLDISSDMYLLNQHQQGALKLTYTLKAGHSSYVLDTWVMDRHENERVSPAFDTIYNYKLKIVDVE